MRATPIAADLLIEKFKGREEMIGIVLRRVANPEIVHHHETEYDVACFVVPETRSEGERLVLAVRSKMFDELVVGKKATGLWQTMHATSDFDVDETVVDERAKILFIHDDVRDHINWDTHIFVAPAGKTAAC